MKIILKLTLVCSLLVAAVSCKSVDITPKQGIITVPAKGEIRQWQNIKHSSFSIHLENKSTKNSCEAYKVSSIGIEKWIYPSLLANGTLDFSVASNGSLLLKNFSDKTITIIYKIN